MKARPNQISVVICTFNNFSSLGKTLVHLTNQDAMRELFEIIVVTNNCTDQTESVIASYKNELQNLRSINEPLQGLAFARICGVRAAKSAWIAFVDDDNFLEPSWITQALKFIELHFEAGIMGGKIDILWETPPPLEIDRKSEAYAATDISPELCLLTGENRWLIRGAGLLCKKEALEVAGWLEWQANVGRCGGKTTAGDDTEIVMRVAREGWQVWYNPACKMNHFISKHRINKNYLIALYYGFGLADANLLALKTRQGYLGWSFRYLLLILRYLYYVVRLSIASSVIPERRLDLQITWIMAKGILSGLLLFKQLGPTLRQKCLGNKNHLRLQTVAS